MLGIFFENVPVGKLVWNIGQILKLLLGKTFAWEPWWTFWKYYLGKTWWKLGKFHLGKFNVRKFGISYLGKSWCPCFAEQKLWKLFIWKSFEFFTWEMLLGKILKTLLGKILFPTIWHGDLTKVTLLTASFCSLVTLSHPINILWRLPLLCHGGGHSLFVFNWLCPDHWIIFCFHRWDRMSSSLVPLEAKLF